MPADAILGLSAKFLKDPHPHKINLSIGVYKNEESQIALFKSVDLAEQILLQEKQNKGYPPIDGEVSFKEEIVKLVLPEVSPNNLYVAHTVGSTSALRLAGELLYIMGIKQIYFSDLTWPNHPQIYQACKIKPITFPYYDKKNFRLDINSIYKTLNEIPPESAILLQLSCHNPTGRDPSTDEWKKIIQIIKERNIFPVIDCAYQGFGQGLQEDIAPLKLLMEQVDQFFLCYSCAKNFGLYGERVGAFIAFDKRGRNLEYLGQNARYAIRANYSTPPIHGGRIVKTILQSTELKQIWMDELKEIRRRIQDLRRQFLASLESKNLPYNFKFIIQDQGLFSLLNFPTDCIKQLREEFGIYILDNGRTNIAGLSKSNMEYITTSIQKVLSKHV